LSGTSGELIGQQTIPEVLAHLGEPSALWIKAISRSGVPTYTSLLKSEKTGWTINLALPRNAIDGPLKQTAIFFATLAIVAILAGLLLSTIVASRFQQALFSLQEQVAQLGRRAILPAPPGPVSEINHMEQELHVVGADLQGVLRQQQILIDEINHRVKNTLATVQAIVRLSVSSQTDVKQYASSLEERLHSLSAAYDLLTENNWEGAELGRLTKKIVAPYGSNRVRVSGPPIVLKPKTALALAAVVQELSTNAAKYGALSTSTGSISIAWRAVSSSVEFDWTESGGPEVRKPTRRGFGSQLINELFSAEVDSNIALDYAPGGVRCHIRFTA
jgi:two-component sensor histidine kinase